MRSMTVKNCTVYGHGESREKMGIAGPKTEGQVSKHILKIQACWINKTYLTHLSYVFTVYCQPYFILKIVETESF